MSFIVQSRRSGKPSLLDSMPSGLLGKFTQNGVAHPAKSAPTKAGAAPVADAAARKAKAEAAMRTAVKKKPAKKVGKKRARK